MNISGLLDPLGLVSKDTPHGQKLSISKAIDPAGLFTRERPDGTSAIELDPLGLTGTDATIDFMA